MKKPSQRRSGRRVEDIELPLIPVMDAFVTLIAFLLLVTSLLSVTLIDSPLPVVSNDPEVDRPKNPLSLELRIDQDQLTLSSSSGKIPAQKFPRVEKGYDFEKLHEAVVQIRTQFPTEKNIVFYPAAEVKYDELIQLMDAVRLLVKTDPPLPTYKDKDGLERVEQFVFPNVVFGNVIGGI